MADLGVAFVDDWAFFADRVMEVNVCIYFSYFLLFWKLNFVFLYFRNTFISKVERRKVKKILYNKYVNMLTIRDDHVDNRFSEKFIPLCHVSYFIYDDRRKLTTKYIYHTIYTFEFICLTNYSFRNKSKYLS